MGQVIQFPQPKTLWGRLKWWWLKEQNLARRYRNQIPSILDYYQDKSKK